MKKQTSHDGAKTRLPSSPLSVDTVLVFTHLEDTFSHLILVRDNIGSLSLSSRYRYNSMGLSQVEVLNCGITIPSGYLFASYVLEIYFVNVLVKTEASHGGMDGHSSLSDFCNVEDILSWFCLVFKLRDGLFVLQTAM